MPAVGAAHTRTLRWLNPLADGAAVAAGAAAAAVTGRMRAVRLRTAQRTRRVNLTSRRGMSGDILTHEIRRVITQRQ
jgi:hypothetical protein